MSDPIPQPGLEVPSAPARLNAGWPLLLAVAIWAVALPLVSRVTGITLGGLPAATMLGVALTTAAVAALVVIRLPTDPVTSPFVGLAAAAASLVVLSPFSRPVGGHALLTFLFAAPWRYALTPLVVHFGLELGWGHYRQRWFGWVVGWYGIQFGMLMVVVIGLITGEAPLVEAVDGTFQAVVISPLGAVAAAAAIIFALLTPGHGRFLRRPLCWALAAIAVGLVPTVIAEFIPAIGVPVLGPLTPAELSLLALPVFGGIAVWYLPFRDAGRRDLAASRVAADLLDSSELQQSVAALAELLLQSFAARGVIVRLAVPEVVGTAGDATGANDREVATATEMGDDHAHLIAPIGRATDPLGDVWIEGRYAGAFGDIERDWLAAILQPVAAVLRARRREVMAAAQLDAWYRLVDESVGELARSARDLPVTAPESGMRIPPTVDAREVLAQLSDGVTGVARHGEGLAVTAGEARDRARTSSDAVARSLDGLSALAEELGRLARHADAIAGSNDTVSGVAFRTNLVANNAAIEATRAGAAGRTFGVLAEEVRRLADTTAATSAAIGQRVQGLGDDVKRLEQAVDRTRHALADAIREAESGEAAAQRLSDAAAELEDSARSLRPAVAEANAVAARRSARDQHLTGMMERFLVEREELANALAAHRDAMERMAGSLARPTSGTTPEH